VNKFSGGSLRIQRFGKYAVKCGFAFQAKYAAHQAKVELEHIPFTQAEKAFRVSKASPLNILTLYPRLSISLAMGGSRSGESENKVSVEPLGIFLVIV
jgi:hypothetical protein